MGKNADNGDNADGAKGFEFKQFATPRIIGGIAIAIIVLWSLSVIFGPSKQTVSSEPSETTVDLSSRTAEPTPMDHQTGVEVSAAPSTTHPASETSGHDVAADETMPASGHAAGTAAASGAAAEDHTSAPETGDRMPTTIPGEHVSSSPEPDKGTDSHATAKETTGDQHALPATAVIAPVHKPMPRGVAFVEAAIQPLDYELEKRWWGWRPNDIINLTDNVNHFQLGVLEVTRRTIVALAERISRHGVTDSLDPDLEEAMNWFMVKASSYWFPSAESKYRDGLDEMRNYLERLKDGKATFYIRTDNLIPLLSSFEDLLGSCDENLVKEVNEDGTPVSFFKADDYFFYTRGVASAMAMVLEAVHHDFLLTIESRNATELLHHAIVSCHRAADLDPWIILDRNLSSIFANHRANMAAPISHARFYLGQLIKTLST